MKLNNFIHEDYMSDLTVCDDLVKWFHSNKKLHKPGGFSDSGVVNHKLKKSTDFIFDFKDVDKETGNSYAEELQTILERYVEVYGFLNKLSFFKIIETVQIQYYKPFEGYRTIHCERSGIESTINRHLAFQTYLNTVEDGGETEFIYQRYKCKAVKGKTLIWPVDWTHAHRGIVSSTEDKYIITGWYSFDDKV